MNPPPHRRNFLLGGLLGAGGLALRSLATGIPASILANPRAALAGPLDPARTPQYLVLSSSAEGDPVNTNAPGTYLDPAIAHPTMPMMAPVPMTLGTTTTPAARPWAMLPPELLARTCFFHHATNTVVHSDEAKVLALNGNSLRDEMFPSFLAASLGPRLGTVQNEPIVLGPRENSETVVYQNRPQQIIAPTALRWMLGAPFGPLGGLTAMRDRDLDRIHSVLRCGASPAQAAFIDQYVRSTRQVRALSESILSMLDRIADDSVTSQVLASVALIKMNAAPVVSIHIPFGGDNHSDQMLMQEATDSVTGIAAIAQLWTTLVAEGLQDRVTFLSLNVFGRTLDAANFTNGRAHNANHHVAVMFGPHLRASVIGGVERVAPDFGASSIDAATGRAVPGDAGSIPFHETFSSMALTLGRAVGVDAPTLAANINGGTAVAAALVPS